MELYRFLQGSLAWVFSVAVLWPANVPLMALAYKVRSGAQPITLSRTEFWTRATVCAFVVAIMSILMIGLDYLLADGMGLPPGPIHLIVLIAYVSLGMWIVFVFYALADLMEGVSLFVIYVSLPVLVLYALNGVVGFWQPVVDTAEMWLKSPE